MSDDAVIARLRALIETGDALARLSGSRAENSEFYSRLAGWRAQSMTAIRSIVGEVHPYYVSFDAEAPSGYGSSAGHGTAVLMALLHDVEAGYLRDQADLVAATVFSDFLDMAGHLLEQNYFHAAASLIGAVVEDGLRRLATKNDVKVAPRDDINALSSKLREKGVLSPLVAKRITLWAEVRNHADHGEWAKVTQADVEEMYKGATTFMAERLG